MMAVGIVNLLEVVHIHHPHVIALGVARRLQIAFQLVTVVERSQRIRRNQKILQVQVNEQNDHGTPEAENAARAVEEARKIHEMNEKNKKQMYFTYCCNIIFRFICDFVSNHR